MDYEKCYLYEPSDERPVKRRRTEPSGLHASWTLRHRAYKKAWPAVHDDLRTSLKSLNQGTVDKLSAFLTSCNKLASGKKVSTAFIRTALSASSDASLMQRAVQAEGDSTARSYALISSSDAGSLKSILKFIIKTVIASNEAIDEDDDHYARNERSGPRLLSYDLQLIADHVKERNIDQVVIGLLDTEALDDRVLSALVELLGYWRDRIPLVFMFNIATSVELLQERLSKGACKVIAGQSFTAAPPADDIEQAFGTLINSDSLPWIGTNLTATMLGRQRDNILTIDAFLDSFQYVFMTCYYANPLSVFLDNTVSYRQIPTDHFEAARNLSTFQNFCRDLLDRSEADRLTDLMDSDEALFNLINTEIAAGHQALRDLVTALEVLRSIQGLINPGQVDARSKLYVPAMSNSLQSSTTLRALMLSTRKSPPTTTNAILKFLSSDDAPEALREQCEQISTEFNALIGQQSVSGTKQPLQSEENLKSSTLRRTVVAQKVALGKQKSAFSKQDAAYTAILRRLTDALEAYFKEKLIDPSTLTFSEIFLYDLDSPHRETFTARPRHAIERALATPQDYMACKCCRDVKAEGQNGESTLAASQPATALLYQLYLEAETLINVNDLWEAFKTILGSAKVEKGDGGKGGDGEEEGHEDSQALALFQRGLAELQYLGFIRYTSRRDDHVAKAAWAGL